jgi:hypothetical protein
LIEKWSNIGCGLDGEAAMRGKQVKVRSKSLATRLAGVSLFGFGASWKAPEPERVVVRDMITELEDKRALYSQAVWEEPNYVIQSILSIREILTGGLKRVGDNSPAKDAFRIMRASCRDFLTLTSTRAIHQRHGEMRREHGMWEHEEFFIELGKLRSVFGQQLALLGYLYGIDIEASLASILPPQADGKPK